MERELRPDPFYHVNDISAYLARQRWGRGSLIKKNAFRAHILHFEPGVSFTNHYLGQKQEDKASSLFFRWETPPPSVYVDEHGIIYMIKWYQAFPLHFAYCKRSKTGRSEGLGTRLESPWWELISNTHKVTAIQNMRLGIKNCDPSHKHTLFFCTHCTLGVTTPCPLSKSSWTFTFPVIDKATPNN